MIAPTTAVSKAPGTCGELVQGFCGAGIPFHVTCPIQIYAAASVTIEDAPQFEITGLAPQATKMAAALKSTASLCGVKEAHIHVHHETRLDIGKGMASSTADILCGATALAKALGKNLSCRALADIAVAIESSDGIMYPGICAVNHKNGDLLRQYDWWPEFNILIIVPGHSLDTSAVSFKGKETLAPKFDAILAQLDRAAATRNESIFAMAAFESAVLNQAFVPNPLFEQLRPAYRGLGAIGMNVAHTGTMLGLLFESSEAGHAACEGARAAVQAIVGQDCLVEATRIEGEREW